MTSESPDVATTTQTDAAPAVRKQPPPTRRSTQRSIGGAAQAARGAHLRLKTGERRDLNPQPPGPQPGALTGLSYAHRKEINDGKGCEYLTRTADERQLPRTRFTIPRHHRITESTQSHRGTPETFSGAPGHFCGVAGY